MVPGVGQVCRQVEPATRTQWQVVGNGGPGKVQHRGQGKVWWVCGCGVCGVGGVMWACVCGQCCGGGVKEGGVWGVWGGGVWGGGRWGGVCVKNNCVGQPSVCGVCEVWGKGVGVGRAGTQLQQNQAERAGRTRNTTRQQKAGQGKGGQWQARHKRGSGSIRRNVGGSRKEGNKACRNTGMCEP